MDSSLNEIVIGTTCFAEHDKRGACCEKISCRQWMKSSDNLNCAIIAAGRYDDGMTLQQIGDIFDVTRMRVCQLEKASLLKLNTE